MNLRLREEVGAHEQTLEEQHKQLQLDYLHFKELHADCALTLDEQTKIIKRQLMDNKRNLSLTMYELDRFKQKLKIAEEEKILWLAELKRLSRVSDKQTKLINEYEEDFQASKKKSARKRSKKAK